MASSFTVRLVDNGNEGVIVESMVASGTTPREFLADKLIGSLNDYLVRVNSREDVLDQPLVPNALIVIAPRNFKGA